MNDLYKIIYCSAMCSEEKYSQLFGKVEKKPGQQVQKYHRVLGKGFAENGSVDVVFYSKLPFNRENCLNFFVKKTKEEFFGRRMIYAPYIRIPGLSNVLQVMDGFFTILGLGRKNTVIIDVLNASMNMGIVTASKLMKNQIVGIITDFPNMISDNAKYIKSCNDHINKCDGYVLLTDAMNDVVNPDRKKPFVIIEGQVDSAMSNREVNEIVKSTPKICMYAGDLNKENGIDYLIDGFLSADMEDWELHIYGQGNYVEDIKQISGEYSNVKFHGTVLNEEIVRKELEASLLVNPRPTNREFVKYSFPSKNMEYMVSGTPLLTTKLPGMPKEYYDKVYLIEQETTDGIQACFREIANLTEKDLREKGMCAKKFVLENKNEKEQSEKIIKRIEGK